MITVRKTENGFERISGNPVVKSLDGMRKARLQVIMHSSWSADDRAEFGIFQAVPANIPADKVKEYSTFEQQPDGRVKEIAQVKDAPVRRSVSSEDKVKRMLFEHGITLDELRKVLKQ